MEPKGPPTKRVDLLKDRNAKLSAEVNVQRKEIERLQRGLEDATAREERLNETVLCVNRLWDELNGAIAFLNFRATGAPVPADKPAAAKGDALEGVNPFLARLLATHLDGDRIAAAAAKALTEDPSDVETALRERMHATMEAAARVLEAVEAGASGDANGKDPKITALNTALKAENGRLRDQALLDETTIRELQANVADREEELLVAQRKLLQLKEAGAGAAPAAAAAPAAPEAPAPAGDAAAPSTSAMQVDGDEVEQYKRQAAARAAEVQERDTALAKADRDIRDLKSKLSSERSAASRAKQAAADRVRALEGEVAALDARLRDAHRECDHLAARLHDAEAAADRGAAAERRLGQARAQAAALESALASARAKREAAENEADRLRASMGAVRTGEELGKAVEALERDLAAARSARDKHRLAAEGAAAASAAAAEATREAAEAKAQLETIRGRVEAARAETAAVVAAAAAAAEREEELRLFAEVAQSYLGGTQADADALRAQVAEFLAGQAQVVSARLQEAQAAAAAAAQQPTPRETELQARAEALEEERAVLATRVEALQQGAEALRAAAEAAQEEAEAVQREVDGVAEAYEAAQEENARLLKAVASRDEDNVRLMSEAAAAMRERAAAAEDRGAAAEATRRAEEAAAAASERAEELEARLSRLAADLDRARKEARSASARADAAARDATAAQAAVDAATRDAEAARKEAAAAAAEVDAQVDALRREKTRAQQAKTDAAEMKARLDRSRSGGGDEEEVTALRSMVMCALCKERVKNRIITICNHVFCNECVQERLSSRSRQCPSCSQKFGANDVRTFVFTH